MKSFYGNKQPDSKLLSGYVYVCILELKKYFVDNSNKQYNLNMDKLIEFKITPREREVISCILEGMTYQEASDTLHISISTAKTHMNNIYKKLEVNNKLEMINKLK